MTLTVVSHSMILSEAISRIRNPPSAYCNQVNSDRPQEYNAGRLRNWRLLRIDLTPENRSRINVRILDKMGDQICR